MKLVVEEADSTALRAYVEREPNGASCALARVEVVRATREYGAEAIGNAQASLDRFRLLVLNDDLLSAAAMLPAPVRTLDAIHLAAALLLGDDLPTALDRRNRDQRRSPFAGPSRLALLIRTTRFAYVADPDVTA